MESTLGNFYFEIKHSSFRAFAFITDMSTWRMLLCIPDGSWPHQATWRRGTWEMRGNVAHAFALGSGTDAASDNNATRLEIFRMTDLEFPPDVNSREGFWVNQFFLSDGFAAQEHIQTGIVKTGPHKLSIPTHGSWSPILSGPLLNANQQKLQAYQEEIKRIAIQLGLDIASLVDSHRVVLHSGGWLRHAQWRLSGLLRQPAGRYPVVRQAGPRRQGRGV